MKRQNEIKTHRVITMLDRQEIDFMDKLGKDALFSTGHKLSYNEILKGLIDFIMEHNMSAKGVDSLIKFKEQLAVKLCLEINNLRKES